MFIQELTADPQYFFAVVFTIIVSITLHELAHGLTAIGLGDRTPIETGHITLNPLVHMGGFSILMTLLAGIAWGAMPINPGRLRGRHGDALVSFAGPLCNFMLAAIALAALGLWHRMQEGPADVMWVTNLQYLLRVFGIMNVVLGLFNLIPAPPLDGSHILASFSRGYRHWMENLMAGGGGMVFFLVIFLFAGRVIFPVAVWMAEGYLRWVRGH